MQNHTIMEIMVSEGKAVAQATEFHPVTGM